MFNNHAVHANRHSIGFKILHKKRSLRSQLVDHGESGYIDFLQACIASGIDHHDELIEEVLDVVGPNVESYVEALMVRYDGAFWRKGDDGIYSLIPVHIQDLR
ncbi:hypothetical protein [Croceicoccus marinus]|uniref:Uncharacterized protein n=1 Tax=Croceicoccus marinus TaxID=450378 RepID=A0A7G6VW83_9SPHN|nr:hypothetical protein [Croceicoccus marinus]QNE05998.1 hypothetical protein H4O24_04960 [Croceicoccus marinus]